MDLRTLHYAIAADKKAQTGVRWAVWYPFDDASSHIRALSGRGSQRCVHPASSASQALNVMRTLGERLVDKSVCAGVSGAHGEGAEAAAGEGAEAEHALSMKVIHKSILDALIKKLTEHDAISRRVNGIFSMIQHGHLKVMNGEEISDVERKEECPTMERYAKFALDWAKENRRCILLTHEILELKERHKSEREVLKEAAMKLIPNKKHAGATVQIEKLEKQIAEIDAKQQVEASHAATRIRCLEAIPPLKENAQSYNKTKEAQEIANQAQTNFDISNGIYKRQQELNKLLPGPVKPSQNNNEGQETETNACNLLQAKCQEGYTLLMNAGILITPKSIDLLGAKMEFDVVKFHGSGNVAEIYEVKSNPTAIFGDMPKIEKLCEVIKNKAFGNIQLIPTTRDKTTRVKTTEICPINVVNTTMKEFARDPWGESSPLRYIAKWRPSDQQATIYDELFFPPSLHNHLCEIVRNECWDELKDYVNDLAYANVTIKTLKESGLDIFDIGKETVTKLCSAASKDDRLWLFEHLYKVDSIDLAKGVLSGEQIIRLCNLLCKHHLQYLDLSDTELGDVGAKQIAEALPKLKNLRHLDLSHNYIREEGAVLIARVLPQLENLRHLDLSNNEIGEEGIALIAGALPKLKKLEHLDLSNNEIGKEGIALIAGALPKLKKLEHLDLSNNPEIGEEGIALIAGALPFLENLRHLDLSDNLLGNSKGISHICEALCSMSKLEYLNLSSNNIETDDHVNDITEALKTLSHLKHLDLSGNLFDATDIKCIVDALDTRCKIGGNLKSFNLQGDNCKPTLEEGKIILEQTGITNMGVVLEGLYGQLTSYLKSNPTRTKNVDYCWENIESDECQCDECQCDKD